MGILTLLSVVFLSAIANAQSNLETGTFEPNQWSPGLHLFAGAGLNATYLRSDSSSRDGGIGSNFKTDIAWFVNDRWAIESSSSVKFNLISADLAWDTLLTVGLRYRLTENFLGYDNTYFRGFIGHALTVLYLKENKPLNYRKGSRLHLEGPVIGAGMGRMMKTKSGTLWFFDANATVQSIHFVETVVLDGEAPIVVDSAPVRNNSMIFSIYSTVGFFLF